MSGKRLALLIGNAEYQHPELRKLNAPQNDVAALETLLMHPEIGRYTARVLINGTKSAIEQAIDRMLSDGDREDTALIFFAGHGLKHENGKLYFAAIDTEPKYLGGTAVWSDWLKEQMQNSRVGCQIVLLDCCFGGAFARGHLWRGGNRVESGEELKVHDVERSGRGQVVITAADAMQFALEEDGQLDTRPPFSHFTRALTEGLASGEADRDGDGRITVDELMSYLEKKLKDMRSPQRPTKSIFGAAGGDLLFAYNPRANVGGGSDHLSTLPVDWIKQAKRYIDAEDYAKALALYQKAADAGYARAMNGLGRLYEYAHGVSQDYSKAREWYQKAAEAGDANGMSNLGELYESALGVSQDYGKARECYQKAAEAGDVDGMNNLGELYESALGVSQDYGKAREWYQKAADAGNSFAMNNLGLLYECGRGVEQDYGLAHDWFQKAAEAGNTYGMSNLGRLYECGHGVEQDYGLARDCYQKAADAGNMYSATNLGLLYMNGWGVAQDYGKAREWFQKAADAGDSSAMSNLGWLYEYGQGVEQHYRKARKWYQKAADAGNSFAMNSIGRLYKNGDGVLQDSDKARDWYQKAADAGNSSAMNNLVLLYKDGQGDEKVYSLARDRYQRAADAGDAWAMNYLGLLL